MARTVRAVSKDILHIPCIVHALHNCIKSSLNKTRDLQALRDKCYSLALFFYSNPKMSQKLYEEQQSHKFDDSTEGPLAVILDVNGTFHMLRRLYALKHYMKNLVLDLDPKHQQELKATMPTDVEWAQVALMISILTPFESLAEIFSSSAHGIAAAIGPRIVGLLQDLSVKLCNDSAIPQAMLDVLISFQSRLVTEVKAHIQLSAETAIATVLHPTFNSLWIYPDPIFRLQVIDTLKEEYQILAPHAHAQLVVAAKSSEYSDPEESNSGFHKLFKRRRLLRDERVGSAQSETGNDLDRYLAVEEMKHIDALVWWKHNKDQYDKVAAFARKYLALPASSVAFSFSNNLVTDKRNRFVDDNDTVSDIVFCHYAAKCINEFKAKGHP
ncbi:hypothetical protein EDD11_006491 [Mortierella claussenii]|nr:hypothetical protein EDD11_006491 [Mortierella claussenii]